MFPPRGETLGNPALEPERNRGVELSSNWQLPRGTVILNAYRIRRDYIERYQVTPN